MRGEDCCGKLLIRQDCKELFRVFPKARQCVGVNNEGPVPGCSYPHLGPHFGADAASRSEYNRIDPRIRQER